MCVCVCRETFRGRRLSADLFEEPDGVVGGANGVMLWVWSE